MGKKGKKIVTLFLAAVLIFQLAACGRNDAGPGTTQAETDNGVQSAQTMQQETEETAPLSMGRYVESTLPLPEGAVADGRSIALLSDGRLAYFDGRSGLWASSDEGKNWEHLRKGEEVVPEGYWADISAIAPDGSVAVNYYGENGTGELEYGISWVDADGNRITAEGETDGDVISGVYFGKNSELYAVSRKGKVSQVNPEDGSLKQLFLAADLPQVLCFSGKMLLTLERECVEIYDLEAGILIDQDPVLDEFCRENLRGKLNNSSGSVGGLLLDGGDGVIYLAFDGGLFRHVIGGNAMEQVIDGHFSTFGDPTVGIISMAVLPSNEFLLLTGGEELIRFTYDPEEPTVPERQLKLYSLKENSRLRQVISLFQKQNTDIYVNYEIGIPENSAVTLSDALKNLNVELMSGNGPDVLLMDGIDAGVYEKKGMLLDLSSLYAELTGEDELFSNLVDGRKTEEGIFVIPATFEVSMICGKKEDIAGVKDLKTLADLVERLREQRPEGAVLGCYNGGQVISQLLPMAEGAFLMENRLDTQVLTEFLTQAKRIYEAENKGISDYEKEAFGTYTGARNIGQAAEFLALDYTGVGIGTAKSMLMDLGALEEMTKHGYDFALLQGETGTGFLAVNQLAIAKNTTRQEDAEAFVRLMLSYEAQKVEMWDGFPMNRKAFDLFFKDEEKQEYSAGSSWMLEDGTIVDFSYAYPTQAFGERFREMVPVLSQDLEGNAVVKDAVYKYGVEMLESGEAVKDAVSNIQKAVSIYLAEQG